MQTVSYTHLFRSLVIGDEIAVAVIDEGRFVLRVQRGQIECGRGIHKSLCNAHNGAHHRQRRTQRQEHGQPDGACRNTEQKIPVFRARLEDGARTRVRFPFRRPGSMAGRGHVRWALLLRRGHVQQRFIQIRLRRGLVVEGSKRGVFLG